MTNFEFTTTYSKRKTVGIKVKSTGEIVVLAPLKTPEKTIEHILETKKTWLLKQLENINKRNTSLPSVYKGGNDVLFLGKRYPIRIVKAPVTKPVEIRSDEAFLQIKQSTDEHIRQAFYGFHWLQTEALVKKSVDKYCAAIGKKPNRITIRDQKTRWGSCSSLQNLNFNWRLSMAPLEVLEYVVVHELCHLIHMNHSSEFWCLVERHCPNYKANRSWLKEWGYLLFG